MRKPIHQPLGKGLRCYLGFVFSLFCATAIAQQCPTIVNCPQSTPTYCDESTNDINLWYAPPFTFSPSIGDADLHEGAIDLNLKLKGCSGGGLGSISYTLYLDLDNDGLQETVLTSNNPPPAGRVMANNSFNPGYSGGDTVLFDNRPLPDSLLHRFALEIDYSGDTTIGWVRFCTDADPFGFIPVILPEGRHRIEWRATQDGIERYCDRNFKIKDCKKPSIACKPGLAVYLDVTQSAVLHLPDALAATSDNITPDSQLVVGMRRVGSGFGFPLDASGNPQDTVMFHCDMSDGQLIELWVRDKAGNLENCSAQVLVYDTAGVCPFVPFPNICARTYWNDQIVRDVTFNISWTIPGSPPIVNPIELKSDGCAELSSLPPTSLFTLSAEKDTVLTNGVTTFDLVLISKHILGLEPFDEGWKIAAADANRSNSVTTFDIVELRKIILGLSNKLPNNTPSWRLFVDTCTVWGTPFYGQCPTAYSLPVQPISSYPPSISFSALKVGDVNGTAASVDTLQAGAQTRDNARWLDMPDRTLLAGESMDLPILVRESAAWEGIQFSLNFDPNVLEINAVYAGESLRMDAQNWAQPQAGRLNVSWSDGLAQTILPGDALLRLRVTARTDLRTSEVFALSAQSQLAAEAYDVAGVGHALQLAFSAPEKESKGQTQVFDPMPNPTNGSAQLPLRVVGLEQVSVEINDLSGRCLWRSVQNLDAGAHLLDIPASAMPQAGVYVWRVRVGDTLQSGRLVRM